MSVRGSVIRSGVYVDVENITRCGGRGARFEALREFACRDGAEALRLNAYLAFDAKRAEKDVEYRDRTRGFHNGLRAAGFKVIEKEVQWYRNKDGEDVSKANSDLDLAIDALLQSTKLDRVVLVTGDGDFIKVVGALQNSGCRVELVAFENVSYALRCEADVFLSGYLIPGVSPLGPNNRWGEIDSVVHGTCWNFYHDRRFGFFRFLANLENVELTDPREPASPYRDVYFRDLDLPEWFDLNLLPNRDMVFRFRLAPGRDGQFSAREIEPLYDYSGMWRR